MRAIRDDRSRWAVHVLLFAPWADAPLASVTKLQAREWWATLATRRTSHARQKKRGRKLAAQTLRNILHLVRSCFEEAVELEIIGSNPFAGLRLHRSRLATTLTTSTVLLPLEQMAGLGSLALLPERWLVAFAMGSGIRQGEQWSLKLADLVLDGPRPHAVIRYGSEGEEDEIEDGPTKGGRVREVRLFGMALDAARRWVAQLAEYAPWNHEGWAFPTREGMRRCRGKSFRGWRFLEMAVGRHVRWHDLRHTCATSLVAGWWSRPCWSLEEVCRYLGHASLQVTERYARLVKELAENAATRMAPPPPVVHARMLRVPLLACRVPRARARSTKTRGDAVDKNDVDAGTTAGENEPSNGAVAKWSGNGLQNRSAPPAGEGPTARQPERARYCYVTGSPMGSHIASCLNCGTESAQDSATACRVTGGSCVVAPERLSDLAHAWQTRAGSLAADFAAETLRANENARALFDALRLIQHVAGERDTAREGFRIAEAQLFDAREQVKFLAGRLAEVKRENGGGDDGDNRGSSQPALSVGDAVSIPGKVVDVFGDGTVRVRFAALGSNRFSMLLDASELGAADRSPPPTLHGIEPVIAWAKELRLSLPAGAWNRLRELLLEQRSTAPTPARAPLVEGVRDALDRYLASIVGADANDRLLRAGDALNEIRLLVDGPDVQRASTPTPEQGERECFQSGSPSRVPSSSVGSSGGASARPLTEGEVADLLQRANERGDRIAALERAVAELAADVKAGRL